jgi:hypothetical protein
LNLALSEISKAGKTLSLYAPKFGLSNLGNKGERIVLRAALRSVSSTVTVFANYVVGRKEAQIAIKSLKEVGGVDVVSVDRYRIADLANDATQYFKKSREMQFALLSQGKSLKLKIGEKEIVASAKEIYASGGEAYLVISCAGKEFRLVNGQDGTKVFDAQRRRVVSMGIQNGEIVFQRAFQHIGPNRNSLE